jgi:nucleoside diphosphate kinase
VKLLDKVFSRLEQAGLKMKRSKCHLFRSQVSYLGHIISAEGVSTDHMKTETVSH